MALHQSQTIFSIRPYTHATDYGAVMDICSKVYSGTDYLPRHIGEYSRDPSYLLLSCHSIANNGLVGVIGGRLTGGMIFVFGLRVKEDQRGQGVAKLLASELIGQSLAAFKPASSVLTVTIPENKAAISIFGKLLGGSSAPRHVAFSWPPSDVRMQYEESIGWPSNQASPSQSMLDHWPWVKSHLLADDMAVKALDEWRPVREKRSLMESIASIYSASSRAYEPELDEWLPGMYETLPVDSQEVDQAMMDRRVWILSSSGSNLCQADAALIVYNSREARDRTIVGILARGENEVNSALLLVHQRLSVDHFMSFIHLPSHCNDDTPPLGIFGAFEAKPSRFISFGIKKS